MKSILKNIARFLLPVALITVLLIFADSYSDMKKSDTEACLSCHDDKDLTMDKGGKTVSIFVSKQQHMGSVHNIAECEDCHEGYNPEELPHTKMPQEVNCQSCHKEAKSLEANVHAKVKCYDCHTKHDVKPSKDFAKQQTKTCEGCHSNKNVQHYSESIHAKNNVGCEGCHSGGHTVKKINKNEVAETCGKCHGTHEKNFSNSIHQTVFASGNKNAPTCTDCHGSHRIIQNKMSIESQACMKCHLDEKKFPGDSPGSAKFVAHYKTSIHASIEKDGLLEAAGCVDCHGDHMVQSLDNIKAMTGRINQVETCGKCHRETAEKFKKSSHGTQLMKNNDKAPACTDCHGEHDIQSVLISDQFSKIKLADKCLSCHKDAKLPHKTRDGEEELTQSFKQSAHYQALEKGSLDAPSFYNCHGAHEMEKADNPDSKINKKNVALTCGQSDCHTKQLREYKGSIHDVAVRQNGNADAPACNTCHGNHIILSTDNEKNPLSSSKGIVEVCSDCHASNLITEKYNIKTKRVETYEESIHGIYVSFGDLRAANCSSCHTNHNIRSEDDPQSTVHPDNISVTCGQVGCHPNASAQFVKGKIHLDPKSSDAGVIYYISSFFKYLTIAVLISLFAYMMLDFITRLRERRAVNKK